MKQVLFAGIILAIASSLTFAQAGGYGQSNPPAQSGQPSGGNQGNAAQNPAAPAAKHPPQAKTQPEFDAFKAATANQDPAAVEKAADEFATKFPDSELRILLYKTAMRGYQNANNADKMLDMGRKALAIDPDDPESLVDVAEVLT